MNYKCFICKDNLNEYNNNDSKYCCPVCKSGFTSEMGFSELWHSAYHVVADYTSNEIISYALYLPKWKDFILFEGHSTFLYKEGDNLIDLNIKINIYDYTMDELENKVEFWIALI